MADLPYIQQAQEVKITGQTSGGATVNYVSADTNGNLFVKDAATSTTSTTVPTNAILIGGSVTTLAPTYTTGNLNPLSLTTSGGLRIALPADIVTTGTIVANGGTVQADGGLQPYTTFVAEITGTFSATTEIGFEQSEDAVNWYTAYAVLANTVTASPNNAYFGGSGSIVVRGLLSGFRYVRAHALAFQAGDSVSIKIVLSSAEGPSFLEAAIPAGPNVIGGVFLSGTVPLPTGASTSALQTSGNTSLTSIQTTSNSTAVNTAAIAANQTNGTQRTLVTDLVGNLQPSGDAPARAISIKVTDGTNIISSTTINSIPRLNVTLASEGVDGSTAPFDSIQIGGKDSSGNLQSILTQTDGQQRTSDVIGVSGQNRAQSVTTSAAEALGAATILVNRKSLTIRPTNGIIYWGFTTGVTTTTGMPIYTNEVFNISATDQVHVYLIAAATVDVRIAEGS